MSQWEKRLEHPGLFIHSTQCLAVSKRVGISAHKHACVYERCAARTAGATAGSAISRERNRGVGRKQGVWEKGGGGEGGGEGTLVESMRRYLSLQRGFGNMEKEE